MVLHPTHRMTRIVPTTMSPEILRVIVLVVSFAAMFYWPVGFVLTLWALAIWLVPRTYRDHQRLAGLRAGDQDTKARVAALEADLAQAHQQIAHLQRELQDAKCAARPTSRGGHPVFRRIGLDENCPRWVAEAVRKAYRKRLHPDTQPPHRRVEAERRFKEAEAVFDQIWASRGF
jgi:hypothetical protein